MIMRRLTPVVVIALLAFVAACSLKTVYNRLDYLIPKYVEGVITLDGVLEQQVEARTLSLLQWHRSTQLKPYAEWLRALQQDVNGQLTAQQLEQRIDETEALWLPLLVKLNDEMAYLLPLLDVEQKRELFAHLEETNEEFREEFVDVDDDARIEDYTERMIDTYENWFGALTDAQERAVEQAAVRLISTAELRLQRRLRWQLGIRTILAKGDAVEIKRERLRAFLANFEQENDPTMKTMTDINQQIVISLTVEIANSLTPDQKEFFVSKTNDYIRMLTELAENR